MDSKTVNKETTKTSKQTGYFDCMTLFNTLTSKQKAELILNSKVEFKD